MFWASLLINAHTSHHQARDACHTVTSRAVTFTSWSCPSVVRTDRTKLTGRIFRHTSSQFVTVSTRLPSHRTTILSPSCNHCIAPGYFLFSIFLPKNESLQAYSTGVGIPHSARWYRPDQWASRRLTDVNRFSQNVVRPRERQRRTSASPWPGTPSNTSAPSSGLYQSPGYQIHDVARRSRESCPVACHDRPNESENLDTITVDCHVQSPFVLRRLRVILPQDVLQQPYLKASWCLPKPSTDSSAW